MAYGSSKIKKQTPIENKKTNSLRSSQAYTLGIEKEKNKYGVVGGAGYLATSFAAGIAGGAEGIIDLGTAVVADITGNHDYAEYVFKDNVVGDWHESITEDFNPGTGWKFAGDVSHGLGQSSWFLLSLIPGAQWLGPTVFGAGMVGQGISSAAEITGDVGAKEVVYGATTAAVETGLETVMGGTGKAVKAIAGASAKKLGKEAIASLVKTAGRKGLAKQILSSAASEFGEEFISEYADTFFQKLYQINPDKEYSLKDALYSGAVGAVSGAISASPVNVRNAVVNQRKGSDLIKRGNAQTTVNTATKVADQLAASGTNFKNAPEWVKTLRGEVDAYNALVQKGQGESLSAQTILGEMQASLYFAETQAQVTGVKKGIMESSEEDRAAWAEYINQSFDKSQRKKDYTAEDIANNTDEIATQLAILKYVKIFDIDGAVAEAEINAKIADEQRKAIARAEQKSAENAPAMANEAEQTAPLAINEETEIKADLKDDVADIEASATVVDDDIYRIRNNVRRAVSNIKVDGKLYELTDKHVNNIARGVQKHIREGMSESEAIALAVNRLVDIKSMGEESGVKHEVGKATLKKVRGAIVNAYRAEMQTTTGNASKTAQEAREVAEGTEAQKTAETSAEKKGEGKAAEKSSEAKEKSSERKNEESQSGEPKISEAKESLTDEQRKEKARKRAEQMIEWEKKNAPTVKELNSAREYVKGFDNLSQTRKASIVRMIRSADGKVDTKTLKGVANLIAAMPRADVEIRFAEGLGGDLGGFYAPKVGGKALIVIDSSTNFKKTIQGTIAHELVHHLEKNAGYKEFAKFVMSRVKPEKKAEVEKKYTEFYSNKYAAEAKAKGMSEAEAAAYVKEKISSEKFKSDVESEVVAKYVGQALNNEKLLKKYADKDKKYIVKIGERLFEKVKTLKKNKEKATAEEQESYKETIKVAEEMAAMVAALAQESGAVTEGDMGTKYSFSSIVYSFLGKEGVTLEEFESTDYKETEGYKKYVEECLNNYRQTRTDFNEAKARKEIENAIAGIVEVAKAAKAAGYDIYDSADKRKAIDSKKRLLFSSLEPNSDYFTSHDISSICDKRKNFAEIYDDIVREEEKRGVPKEKRFFSNVNNYFYIHDLMAKKGLTQPCRQCYVESMRKNLAPMANAFIDLITETNPENKKNRQLYNAKGEKKVGNYELREKVLEYLDENGLSPDYLTVETLTTAVTPENATIDNKTAKSLADLRLQHPRLYEAFNSFYGQSKPKMPKEATPFRFGELTALLTNDKGEIVKSRVERINATGGFRLQSYSDFQIKNFVDVLQVLFEAGTLGLNGHAYTKVPAFLDATANTNLKRNISIFMYKDGNEWKIDRNDSFPYTLDKIYEIVDADKSGNTGIIAVSQNDDMSAWIMANDKVAYGIPFHKSGIKMDTVRETVVKEFDKTTGTMREVKGYKDIKDHTKFQSEVYKSGPDKGKKVKKPINIYSFWDFENKRGLSKNKLVEKNVKKYIDMCEDVGYLPKFRDYVMNNSKILESVLAYSKEMGFVPQDATVDDISFKYKGYTIPYGYYKFLGDFSMFTPDGKASSHEVLSLKNYDFDAAVKFFENAEVIRQNELLQQIANGEERDRYRKMLKDGEITTNELERVIKEKRDEVVAEVVGETKYDIDGTPEQIAEWEKPITLNDVEVLRSIGRKSINKFTSEEIKIAQKWAYKFYKDLGTKSPFFRAWFGEWRAHDDKTKVFVVKIPDTATENQRSLDGIEVKDTQQDGKAWKVVISGHGERNTRGHSGEKKKSVAGLTNIKGLVENAVLFNTEVHEHHDNNAVNDYIAFDHKLYSLGVNKNGSVALYRITVEEYYQDWRHPDSKRFHNLKYVEEVAQIPVKNVADNLEGRQDFDESRAVSFDETSATTYSIADLYGFVKSFDKEFSPAPGVSEYVLNEDGTPKVFYHGTRAENGEFWEFDYSKAVKKGGLGLAALGKGNYFSANDLTGVNKYSRVIPAYLSIKTPFVIESDMNSFFAKVGEALNIDVKGMTAAELQQKMRDAGYDGVILTVDDNVRIAVTFDSQQIKSAIPIGQPGANIGTFDSNNADIRYDLADEEPKRKAKTKAEIAAENSFLKKQNRELNDALVTKQNKISEMREKLARERAELSKAENAEVFDKSDVELAVKSIESWTEEEALSLAKGNVALNKMGKAKREEMISQIYIALHEQGAVGRTGLGSIAVKNLAAKIAGEYIDSAAVAGEDGKLYHLADIYDEVTMGKLKQELTNLLYGEFAHMGKSTGVNELVARMRAQKQAFRQERFNDATIAKAAKDVAYQAHELRKLAEQQKREGATESIQLVTKNMAQAADAKGNVSVKLLDQAIGEASRFLSGEAFKSESISGEAAKKESILDFDAVVDEELKFKIDEYLRLREEHKHKALTAEEMRLAGEILRKMKATIERYNKEYINGHYVEVDELVVSAVSDLISFAGKQKDYKNKVTKFLGEKLGKKANEWYFYQILSPETVIEAIEGYKQGGLLKSLYHSVRVAKQKAEHRAVQMKKPFAEFLDNKENAWEEEKDGKIRKHSYRNKLNKKLINVNGNEITLGEAIYLLMLTKREHAHRGLQESGYKCYSDDGQVTASFKVLDIERTRDLIYNQLDKTDLEFLKMAEEFFNVTSTKVKQDADNLIFGYTNTQDGYYVPIIRDRYSRMNGVTDARQSIGSIITVYNKSFNQNIVQNAKALEGKSIMRIINDHADGLADYAEMYLPLKAFDRVYNRGVVGADGNTTTIREVVGTKVWNGAEGYFKELFQDVQGQSRQNDSTMLNRAVGFMRSAWVNSVLGANIKVVATQTTSLGAATQIIEPKYITAALSVIGKRDLSDLRTRAYEYSDIIEARNFDMGALKAQGNIDKVGKIGEKTGFLIGWMDERICFAIFHAAELKVEAQGGGAVGTEDNAIAAARIADEAIYTTQAMSSASERSALQRSPNEIAKVFSMFTSDSVKNLSHFYGNIMKFIAHSERVKAGDTSYEALLENDKKEILRSARTIAITGIMLGIITQAFKYLYAKEEEEPEDKLNDFGLDIVSSTLNILPGFSDVIDKFVFNYDMSVNVLDVANDTIETFGKGAKLAGKSMNGEFVSTQDVASVMIDIIKSTLSFGGIPISPIERTVTGLLRRFAPSAIYGYDAMFYNPSYTSDLKAAVESGDDALAEHVLSTLYKNEVAGVYTSDELSEVVRLYGLTDEEGKHYNVLPQKIGTEVNGVKLSSAQRKKFTSIYAGASSKVNELIDSPYYQTLNDEQRAKAIKNIYALYYNRAAAEVTGEEWTNAQAYSQLTSNYPALFAAQAYKSGLAAYKDESGREVTVRDQLDAYMQNLGLSDGDYLVISYALGYKSKENKAAIIAYINSLSLTPEVKAQIAERLGFEVKDGVVVEKEE